MQHLWFALRYGGVIIGTLVALYTVLWSSGLAFVTNNQVQKMIDTSIETHWNGKREILQRRFTSIGDRIDKIASDFSTIHDTVSRLDERTKSIDDNVKALRNRP